MKELARQQTTNPGKFLQRTTKIGLVDWQMNSNKHQVAKNKQSQGFLERMQSLPIVPRVYLYICVMGIVGAAMGGVKYRVEAKKCHLDDSCWTVQPETRKIRELSLGALVGIGAATLISIPALVEE